MGPTLNIKLFNIAMFCCAMRPRLIAMTLLVPKNHECCSLLIIQMGICIGAISTHYPWPLRIIPRKFFLGKPSISWIIRRAVSDLCFANTTLIFKSLSSPLAFVGKALHMLSMEDKNLSQDVLSSQKFPLQGSITWRCHTIFSPPNWAAHILELIEKNDEWYSHHV